MIATPIGSTTHLNEQTLSARANVPLAIWENALNAAHDAREPVADAGMNQASMLMSELAARSRTLNTAGVDANVAAEAKPEPTERSKLLREKAQVLVNQFFLGSVMKQMRDSPFKDTLFSGGKAGGTYAGMFDQHLTERMGGRVATSLVDAIVKRWERPTRLPRSDDNPLNAATTGGE